MFGNLIPQTLTHTTTNKNQQQHNNCDIFHQNTHDLNKIVMKKLLTNLDQIEKILSQIYYLYKNLLIHVQSAINQSHSKTLDKISERLQNSSVGKLKSCKLNFFSHIKQHILNLKKNVMRFNVNKRTLFGVRPPNRLRYIPKLITNISCKNLVKN